MYYECSRPGKSTLEDYNEERPFSTELALNSGNSRNTWRIQQAEDQQRKSCQRCNGAHDLSGAAKQHRDGRYNRFLCHEAGDQCRNNAPVTKADRIEDWRDCPCHDCENAGRRIINQIQ